MKIATTTFLSICILMTAAYASEPPLKIEAFAIKETGPTMTVVNTDAKPLRLTSGSVAPRGNIFSMFTKKKGLQDVAQVQLPAGGQTVLRPENARLMVIELKPSLKAGEIPTMTISVARGQQHLHAEALVAKSSAP